MRPKIGITPNGWGKARGANGAELGADYAEAVAGVGGLPFILPLTNDPELVRELAEGLDGLLLSGGPDVDPGRYGEEPRPGLGEVAPLRDALEFMLLDRMLAADKPVFGICRGVQVMNAFFGGTLYQDLERERDGVLQHSQSAPRDHLAHRVELVSGTRLARIVGAGEIPVNTFHHQAVNQLAPGCVANAFARDGVLEGLEHPGYRFALGVQWHPENFWRNEPSSRSLFSALVQAAQPGDQAAEKLGVLPREA